MASERNSNANEANVNIEYRDIKTEDIARLRQLGRALFPWRSDPELMHHLRSSLSGRPVGTVVAVDDGRIVGMAGMGKCEWSQDSWHLLMCGVSASHRGKGIGLELTLQRISRMRPYRPSIIHVTTKQPRMFEEIGFFTISTTADGRHHMCLTLEQ
jgi:predicted N-acetyltransferase YhbS